MRRHLFLLDMTTNGTLQINLQSQVRVSSVLLILINTTNLDAYIIYKRVLFRHGALCIEFFFCTKTV